MSRENTIVLSIMKYLNQLQGCVAEKVQGTALNSGKADINGCYRGTALRIEVKTPDHGNTASDKQNLNLRRWAKAGALCMVAYSLDDVKSVIRPDGINRNYCKKYGPNQAYVIGEDKHV